MTEGIVGWTPLSQIGGGIEGEIGAETDVRLVLNRYGVGILTTNADPEEVGIDPATGELSPVGTDVGLGAAFRRYITAGLYNGDFYAAPSNTSDPIGPENGLPYWRFVQSASSNLTITSLASNSASGRVLRFEMGPGDAADTGYIEQIVPVNGSRTRSFAYSAAAAIAAEEPLNAEMQTFTDLAFLKSDATTVVGLPIVPDAVPGSTFELDSTTLRDMGADMYGYPVPEEAYFLRYRLGMRRNLAHASSSGSFLAYEGRVHAYPVKFLIPDQSNPDTYRSVELSKANGTFRLDTNVGSFPSNPTMTVSSTGTWLITNGYGGARWQWLVTNDTTGLGYPSMISDRVRGEIAVASSYAATQDGDTLGSWFARGHNGSTISNAARVSMAQDGAIMGSSVPGRVSISTTSNGSITERLRVTAAGHTQPGADNTYTIGTASRRWSDVYAVSGSVNTSDAREKQWRGDLTRAEMRAAWRIIGRIGAYRWREAVARKGAEARFHVGVTAQTVADAFTSEGLDPERYGIWCHDIWEASSDGPAGDRYSLRYDELLIFLAAAMSQRMEAMEARLTALESPTSR